jgi:hypothetical protein
MTTAMSDLRTRIAAALKTADRKVAGFISYEERADAVIAELGLRQEIKEAVKTPPKLTFTRYLTDWKETKDD